MKYIASCSFGKDSLATILLALRHHEPLDEVVYCEVMFDKQTSGEIPEHRDFIYDKAIPRLKSWGLEIKVLRSKKTYIDCFMRICGKRSKNHGKHYSFPIPGRCSINSECKKPPIKEYLKAMDTEVIQYLGIAVDEQKRLLRMDAKSKVSLLAKYGKTEMDAFNICRKAGLLSPAYEFTNRLGCFFCPNCRTTELRHLYDHNPDLWARMLELQNLPNKATNRFNRVMTFTDIDNNFRFDDAQLAFY